MNVTKIVNTIAQERDYFAIYETSSSGLLYLKKDQKIEIYLNSWKLD